MGTINPHHLWMEETDILPQVVLTKVRPLSLVMRSHYRLEGDPNSCIKLSCDSFNIPWKLIGNRNFTFVALNACTPYDMLTFDEGDKQTDLLAVAGFFRCHLGNIHEVWH
jgi:uncharacterized protein YfaT (DUF1175 family)